VLERQVFLKELARDPAVGIRMLETLGTRLADLDERLVTLESR
jgi:CRP-like cAMP-binding protein